MDLVFSNKLILHNILDCVSPWDLGACACVCWKWNNEVRSVRGRKSFQNVSLTVKSLQSKQSLVVGCRRGPFGSAEHTLVLPLESGETNRRNVFEQHNDHIKRRALTHLFRLLTSFKSVDSVLVQTRPLEFESGERVIEDILDTFELQPSERQIEIESLVCDYEQVYLLAFLKPKYINLWSGRPNAKEIPMDKRFSEKILHCPFLTCLGDASWNLCPGLSIGLRSPRHLWVDTVGKESGVTEVTLMLYFYLWAWKDTTGKSKQGPREIVQLFFRCPLVEHGTTETLDQLSERIMNDHGAAAVPDPLRNTGDRAQSARVLQVYNADRSDSVFIRVDHSDSSMNSRNLPSENRNMLPEQQGKHLFVEIAKQLKGYFKWPQNIC